MYINFIIGGKDGLTEEGTKSPVGKRTRGAPGAGAVWFPARRIPRHVVLTEGIEDVLSVVRVLAPAEREVAAVAAGLSASRIARVGLPPEAVSVTPIRDADRAGEAAWEVLRQGRAGTGLRVRRSVCRRDPNADLQELGAAGFRARTAAKVEEA